MIKYYRLVSDDRYWSLAEAAFVAKDSISEDVDAQMEITDLPNQEELAVCLKFYGCGLGELAGPGELAKQFEEAVSQRLDAFAREKQYDNMDKARLASLSTDFKADGDYANQVYDRVWLAAFALEERIMGGTLSVADALAQLPAMKWPKG